MFTTTLTAAVLGGLMSSGSLESPKWRTSYRDAALAAADVRKPIAVFITTGSPAKLVKEGSLDKEAAKLLRDGYIPLTIDTGTVAGKELAETFNMKQGLVISDGAGGVQALRHEGSLSDAELKGYLKQFATTKTAATTEYRGEVTAPMVVYQPQYQYYQQQYSQPRPVLNAIQNVGGFVQQVGSNAIQNFGGFMSGST